MNAVIKKILPYIIGIGAVCVLFAAGYFTGNYYKSRDYNSLKKRYEQVSTELTDCRTKLADAQKSLATARTELDRIRGYLDNGSSGVISGINGIDKVSNNIKGDIEYTVGIASQVQSVIDGFSKLSN